MIQDAHETDVTGYKVGDKVRLMRVPPYLYTDNPVNQDTAEFIGRCVGKIFHVEDFDGYGQLELWVTEKGNQRKVRDRHSHVIWTEPEFVELFRRAEPNA